MLDLFKYKPIYHNIRVNSSNCEECLKALGFSIIDRDYLYISTIKDKSIQARWYKLDDRLVIEYITVRVWDCDDLDYTCLKKVESDDRCGGMGFGQVWNRTSDNVYNVEIMFDQEITDETILKLNCSK